MNSFEDLEVWKSARILRNLVLEHTSKFPKEEKYSLIDQILRSSRSVTANIAEGFGRFHYQENIQFCRTARGSLFETLDHMICAFDCRYIDEINLQLFRVQHENCLKLLNGYIAYLKRAKAAQQHNNLITR
ncbi:four helix bundle protein [Mucilaginibacter galii]|uniref:four helix bundle protein n=1 Tax=Mucilaginibacter galii TaxID=2005073 RepID=UPI001667E7DC|nr:four helix bundle protein [Mucilaginibacter galii]